MSNYFHLPIWAGPPSATCHESDLTVKPRSKERGLVNKIIGTSAVHEGFCKWSKIVSEFYLFSQLPGGSGLMDALSLGSLYFNLHRFDICMGFEHFLWLLLK